MIRSTNLPLIYPALDTKEYSTRINDAYRRQEGLCLKENNYRIEHFAKKLLNLENLEDISIHSGIHFFNLITLNTEDVRSNPSQPSTVAIFSPSAEKFMPSNHFTFLNMLSAFEYCKDLE